MWTGIEVSAAMSWSRPAQQRAAAGQHDALVHDVGGQLGRRGLQGHLDRLDDLPARLGDRPRAPPGLVSGSSGQARDQVGPRTRIVFSSGSGYADPI
jgi:hypothetical protein